MLAPPPAPLAFRCDEYGDFILSVNRLDRAKRIDLLLEAAKEQGLEVVVAGDGPDRARLEALASKLRYDPSTSVTFYRAEGIGEDSLARIEARWKVDRLAPAIRNLYRQANAAGGALKLAGVQKRVETMLTMTGAQNFIEVHPDEPSAVKSFGA